MSVSNTTLPWRCPQHPDAQIRHSWTRHQYVYGDGYPRGGHDSDHKYECAECGLELAPPRKEPS